ncbi:hypothetical protein SALBM135S_02033 [Streptomyces alboniger]
MVTGFWPLVVVGARSAGDFDADVGFSAPGLRAVPVSVVVSTAVVVAWLSTFTGSVLINHSGLTGLAHAAADLDLLLTSVPLAWHATCALTRWCGACRRRGLAERHRGAVPRGESTAGGEARGACGPVLHLVRDSSSSSAKRPPPSARSS